jgi:uracil-DNA glycosylase family 4
MTIESVHKNRFLTPSQPMEKGLLSTWELNQVRICSCERCPRLVAMHRQIQSSRSAVYASQSFWNRPVPGFGDPFARILVIGLAPTVSGSNRTGRLFTGDSAGDFLFSAMYRAGFSNQPHSRSFADEIVLKDVYLSSIVRCVAPKNRPYLSEIDTCQIFLESEIRLLKGLQGVIVLGHFAFDRLLTIYRAWGTEIPHLKFEHGAMFYPSPNLPWILCSYHPSRQNTQTGRLKQTTFDMIWEKARLALIP